ncbi:MAG: OmpA family protein [Prevotellaceae bacterium]|jgi:outer membrane protein OmpA-like peptidoglycan-associated protein|nr:OmpA family protein [Prevotellaceae bacterium]
MNQKKFFNSKALFAAVLFLLISSGISAQKTRHYLGGWLYGGYSAMFHSMENTKVLGGVGGGIGVGYQLKHNQFLFNTGIEFELFNSASKIKGLCDSVYMFDTQDTLMRFHYDFMSYRDRQVVGYVNIPLLAGMQFNGNIPFYFLAGVKIGTPVLGSYSSKGKLNTKGYYERIIGDIDEEGRSTGFFSNMPTHYYTDNKIKGSSGKSYFNMINVAASVEFGVDLNKYIFKESAEDKEERRAKRNQPRVKGKRPAPDFKKETPRVRVALFADYSFLNANNYNENKASALVGDIVPMPTTEAWFGLNGVINKNLPTNSLLASTRAVDKPVNPFIVGVKGTIFFDVTKPKMLPDPPVEKPKPPVKPPVLPITGKIINVETNEEIAGAAVDFFDLNKNNAKVLSIAKTQYGVFQTKLDRKGSYRVNVKAPNYYEYSETTSNVGDTLMIYMQPFRKNETFIVRNIYFAFDKVDLIETSNIALDSLANFLNENPGIKFKVTGHTDNKGSDAYNERLSNGRAQEVVKALIARGIEESRLTFEGKGAKEPICPANDTEECRAENRRVEFEITDIE